MRTIRPTKHICSSRIPHACGVHHTKATEYPHYSISSGPDKIQAIMTGFGIHFHEVNVMVTMAIRDVTKTIKGKKMIHGLTFDVKAGEVFGLLGPNGAGKTT